MPELRRYPLAHDQQYILDGAADSCGITAAADIAIRLYADSDDFDRILADVPTIHGEGFINSLHRREVALEEYGARLMLDLAERRRCALVQWGVSSIVRGVRDKADWLCDANYEDETKGGCMKDFRKRWRLGNDELPTKKLMRRLRSRKRIAAYVAAEPDIQHVRAIFRILARGIPADFRGFPEETLAEERQAIIVELDGQRDAARVAMRQAAENARWIESREVQKALEDRLARDDPMINESVGDQVDRVIVRLKPGIQVKWRKLQRQKHRVTKRAAMIAAAFLGASVVSAFARGEAVMLTGPGELALSARPASSVMASGHGALHVDVHGNGRRVASLCVYQEAPALDQLVALALHMQTEGIAPILATGNLYAVEPEADQFPALASRKRVQDPVGEWRSPSRYAAGKTAYIEATRQTYMEQIAAFVFGRCFPVWRRVHADLLNDAD